MGDFSAKCRSPAGKGPGTTCKHIGALCYLFMAFCESGTIPEFFNFTNLQVWNQPGTIKLDAKAVTDLKEHKININAVNLNRQESSRTPGNYDPRPLHLRFADAKALELLKADLFNINQRCAFNYILVSCSERAHDHTYSRQFERDASESDPVSSHQLPIPAICPFDAERKMDD